MRLLIGLLRAAAAFFIVLVIAYFVLGPRLEKLFEQQDVLDQMKREYIYRKWQTMNRDALHARRREAEELLNRASAMLPTTFDGQAERMIDAARRHHVSLNQTTLGPEVNREFWGVRWMRIAATGRYHDLGAFAAELDRLPGCLRLQDLSLYPSPSSRELRVEAVVWAYRYIDEAEMQERQKRQEKAAGKAKE
jgi:type IV pilus assembly protein PilO